MDEDGFVTSETRAKRGVKVEPVCCPWIASSSDGGAAACCAWASAAAGSVLVS